MAKKKLPAQSPLDAALMATRLELADVAVALGVARPTLVSWMQGHRPTPPAARAKAVEVLRGFAGDVLAAADQLERSGGHVHSMQPEPEPAHTESMQPGDVLNGVLTAEQVESLSRSLRNRIRREQAFYAEYVASSYLRGSSGRARRAGAAVRPVEAMRMLERATGKRQPATALRLREGTRLIIEELLTRMPGVERDTDAQGNARFRWAGV